MHPVVRNMRRLDLCISTTEGGGGYTPMYRGMLQDTRQLETFPIKALSRLCLHAVVHSLLWHFHQLLWVDSSCEAIVSVSMRICNLRR